MMMFAGSGFMGAGAEALAVPYSAFIFCGAGYPGFSFR